MTGEPEQLNPCIRRLRTRRSRVRSRGDTVFHPTRSSSSSHHPKEARTSCPDQLFWSLTCRPIAFMPLWGGTVQVTEFHPLERVVAGAKWTAHPESWTKGSICTAAPEGLSISSVTVSPEVSDDNPDVP